VALTGFCGVLCLGLAFSAPGLLLGGEEVAMRGGVGIIGVIIIVLVILWLIGVIKV
jgi:hypothetical protein